MHERGDESIAGLALLAVLVCALPATSQESDKRREAIEVQIGSLDNLEMVSFLVRDLRAGDRLEIQASGQSGNLDPFIAVIGTAESLEDKLKKITEHLLRVAEEGGDAYAEISRLQETYGLTWDDDSGPGYDAYVSQEILEDGDYRILLSGGQDLLAIGEIGKRISSGRYRLAVAINTSLGIQPVPSGQRFLMREQAERPVSIQRLDGWVSAERPLIEYRLKDLNWGESLRVRIASPREGHNAPRVRLLDFGGKQLAIANARGNHPAGEFKYTFDSRASNHRIIVDSTGPEQQDFTLIVGRGTWSKLSEASETQGQSLVDEPISVQVALELEQIVNVDQKSENFGAVANLRMEWRDDRLAFSAASCDCDRLIFDLAGFEDYVSKCNASWPQFILKNQQGNRWSQEKVIGVRTTGQVQYFERFTTTFQAPEFNFADFPLDDQDFYIHVRCLRPQEEFELIPDAGRSSLGTKLGEEEWVMRDFTVQSEPEGRYSGIAFQFIAKRHLTYYLLRVMIPIGLIVMVGWMSFALSDYGKRIDISAGNMLAFIAFNFTISSDLPRLGYVTFIDMLMLATFVVCAVLIAVNVHCRRQEALGHLDKVRRLDRWLIWIYPFCFIIPPGLVYVAAL